MVWGVEMRLPLSRVCDGRVLQKSLPLLANGASVILTGTIASMRGFPGRSAYAASKTALRSHARTWTMELKDRGIRVNTITPGQSQAHQRRLTRRLVAPITAIEILR
jgi:NAD(P)-dependent dehydrogenase (short-subunit alcohol dehydrogenase family)